MTRCLDFVGRLLDRGCYMYYALLRLFEPEERALFESGGDRGLRVDGSGVGAG